MLIGSPVGAQELSFAGIGLHSDFDSVAARFPHSQRSGQYLYVSEQDSRDHIYGIELSGSGSTRRARIAFERQRDGAGPEYPTCAAVQTKIARDLGKPDNVRKFFEEASERSDRQWRRGAEEMTLICFRDAAGQLRAEAVLITPR